MGIFTTSLLSEGNFIENFYNAEAELQHGDFTNEQQIGMDESYDLNFTEQAIYAVAENSKFYYNTMKEIGLEELAYFENTGREIIYEGVSLSSLGQKIKAIFRKIIDKVKQLFHMLIARLRKIFGDNKNFVNKYRTEFVKGWNNLSDSASINGFEYTIADDKIITLKDITAEQILSDRKNKSIAESTMLTEALSILNEGKKKKKNNTNASQSQQASGGATQQSQQASGGATQQSQQASGSIKFTGKYDSNTASKEIADMQEILKKYNSDREARREYTRGEVLAYLNDKVFTKSISLSNGYTEKEFADAIFEGLRNGESTKQKLEIKDKFDATDIMTKITDFTKVNKIITKLSSNITSASNKLEKYFDSRIKEFTNKQAKDDESKFNTVFVGILNMESAIGQNWCNDATKALGIVATALKERTAQYKSIMVKVISGSKKYTEESYQYGNDSESTNSGSILDRVTIL